VIGQRALPNLSQQASLTHASIAREDEALTRSAGSGQQGARQRIQLSRAPQQYRGENLPWKI
jgi:hypothetical protein